MNHLTDAELAWVAGLFEGEGCIGKSHNRIPRAKLALGMTDRDVVERLHRLVGVGNIYHRERGVTASGAKRKDAWTWSVNAAHDVADVLEAMLPWLGERRGARAREALAIWYANPLQKERTHCQRGHAFADGRLRKERTDRKNTRWRLCLVCHRERMRLRREAA